MKHFLARVLCAALGLFWLPHLAGAADSGEKSAAVLFTEGFEDPRLLDRGWYDGRKFTIADTQPFKGTGCLEYTQFLLTPYFGPGLLPHEQTFWIDELTVGRARIGAGKPAN